jgi:hypothetical protein
VDDTSSSALGALGGAPAIVGRPVVVQSVLALPLGLPERFTRMNLATVLSEYKLEDFAATAFRRHRTGKGRQKTFIPIANLLSFTATPLKKPLLKAVPRRLKKTAAELFETILQFTGDCSTAEGLHARDHILELLKQYPKELVDECFMQVVKQTINARIRPMLGKTWQLFLLVASIYPIGEPYMPILAHCARTSADPDRQLAAVAAFTFMRIAARHYLNTVFEYTPKWLNAAPTCFIHGASSFGCLLYECLWCQRSQYPKLPIPYVIHYMITLLKEHGALTTPGLFSGRPRDAAVAEVLAVVNFSVKVLGRADVATLAALLTIWLRELPNPLVPVELLESFETMANATKYLGFVEQLPQAHQLTLLYLIGFLQEVCKNGERNGCNRATIAAQFGPCIVNPERTADGDSARIRTLSELGTAFCARLIEAKDTSAIYPIPEQYLKKKEPKKGKKSSHRSKRADVADEDVWYADFGDAPVPDADDLDEGFGD